MKGLSKLINTLAVFSVGAAIGYTYHRKKMAKLNFEVVTQLEADLIKVSVPASGQVHYYRITDGILSEVPGPRQASSASSSSNAQSF